MAITKSSSGFPFVRMRRNRKSQWLRDLVSENRLSVSDLIWPIFIVDGSNQEIPVPSMPGVYRYSIDKAISAISNARELGVLAVALFPCTEDALRSDDGKEALNSNNLVCRAVREIKKEILDIGIICDVALDPYTSHGHDGLFVDGEIANDATIDVLIKQALVQVEAGCDIIAPSDMMDGRVRAIREALESNGYYNINIMAYTAKYASAFYGPFRDAIGSSSNLSGDKKTYQMDPANIIEAKIEAQLDINEGADMIMVKPGMPYLDIIAELSNNDIHVFAYQVSGEYSMLNAAAANGWFDLDKVMLESLLAFKRAGARGILSYFAPKVAQKLKNA